MLSGHPITNVEMAHAHTAEILRQAAQARLAHSITAQRTSESTSLRQRLGSLFVRVGERLQTKGVVQPIDEIGTSAGVLHLAR